MNLEKYKSQIDFISNYRNAFNAASGSEVDANANVSNKNIATMAYEMPKKQYIGTNRLLMYEKIDDLFGKELADEYIRQLESHEIYKHDETSIMSYTYGAHEVINVKYNKHIYSVGFSSLYNLCNEYETLLDEEKDVYAKYPNDMYILDRGGWTRVERLIKKKRHRDLVRVKTAFNNDIIVTDNHPLIIGDDVEQTIEAIQSRGYKQYVCNENILFGGVEEIDVKELLELCQCGYEELDYGFSYGYYKCIKYAVPKKIKLNRDTGYFVGAFIGDGYYGQGNNIAFTQKEGEILNKIKNIGVKEFHCGYSLNKGDGKTTIQFSSPIVFALFQEVFRIKRYSHNINIPVNILDYNRDFAIGIIEGLIDTDGTINYGAYNIRMSSREAICQISNLINILGIPSSMTQQQTRFGCNDRVQQKYQLFGTTFREREEGKTLFNRSFKAASAFATKSNKSKFNEWITIDSVNIIDNDPYLDLNGYIYDITTESHSFICNGLWVHNCVSISMYPFLLNGLKSLGGISEPPKNLNSFCGSFINLVFAIGAQFAGAVATPEFFTYMDYFIRKEYGNDYYKYPTKIAQYSIMGDRTIDKVITECFQQVIYSCNQPAAARGYQSLFWNSAYFDKPYFEEIFKDFVFPDGDEPQWESVSWLQKRFMKWFNNERSKAELTFPVETVNLLNDGVEFIDKEWADFTAEMYAEGHSFFTYTSDSVDSLSSCCRLKNGITNNTFSYTLGAGGISTGSKSVITINLNRIIQNIAKDSHDITLEDISEAVRAQVKKVHKYQIAFNEIVKDNFNARLLPVYDAGYISMKNQYLTVGINGGVEAAEFLGIDISPNNDYFKFWEAVLKSIYEENRKAKTDELMFNTEYVPKMSGHRVA